MEYDLLCDRVEEIDNDAANYMRNEAKSLKSFSLEDHNQLSYVFYWRETPQGHEYWERLSNKLDKENY